jgi:hypothetical protein
VRVPVAAAGAWADATTWVAHVWLTETPFRLTFTLTDDGTDAHLEVSVNPSFGPTEFASLQGRRDSGGPARVRADAAWVLSAQVTETGAVTIELAEAAAP